MEVTFPRIVLAEFNTHRMFCLAGDALLEFDAPSAHHKGARRVQRMRLDEFADKWFGGARRTASNPKKIYDLSWVQPDVAYDPRESAAKMGGSNPSVINTACRDGRLPATKEGRRWVVLGKDLLAWRASAPEHTRFDIRDRLRGMHIRQLNETTGRVQTSTVVNVCRSGEKEVFEVTAGKYRVAGSKDHRVLTMDGWKTIGELTLDDHLIVRKFGKEAKDKFGARFNRIDGVWRCAWQRQMRDEFRAESTLCRSCGVEDGVVVHHVVPVYEAPHRALDKTNVTLLCFDCHEKQHHTQGWQGGTYLYGAPVKVKSIKSRGVEQTYDLEIAGDFPNFLANGVVVHNSRNSASSRAIPVEKMLKRVKEDPFIPIYWGKNQKGMQADEELTDKEKRIAESLWLITRDDVVTQVERILDLGVHKQITNRLLEPFMWNTVIVTATEWENFFALRTHRDAQPEIREIAVRMKDLYLSHEPKPLKTWQWHVPLVEDEDQLKADGFTLEQINRIAVGRCARVSYLTHEGQRDPKADLELCERLQSSGHMSPFEHIARALPIAVPNGNFVGWEPLRKRLPNEAIYQPSIT